jgi:hypothetical protein
MNINDLYPQLNLTPLLVHDDQTILSDQIPAHYMARQAGISWFRIMEEIFADSPIGERILVRRDTYYHPLVDTHVTHDYITTRVAHETLYGRWTHQTVVYLHNEVSPYPFTLDAFHDRDRILSDNHNNHMLPREAQPNPLPEGHVQGDAINVDPAPIVQASIRAAFEALRFVPPALPPHLQLQLQPQSQPLEGVPALRALPALRDLPPLPALPASRAISSEDLPPLLPALPALPAGALPAGALPALRALPALPALPAGALPALRALPDRLPPLERQPTRGEIFLQPPPAGVQVAALPSFSSLSSSSLLTRRNN